MISIDLSRFIPHELTTLMESGFVGQILDTIAASAHSKWVQLARQELRSSKREYIKGIQDVAVEDNARVITLLGWLANAIEQGHEGWDLRTTLLGRGARTSKAGHRYRPIPFRHATPGSQGEAGTPMGSRMGPQGSASLAHAASGRMSHDDARRLGGRLYRAAQKLRSGQRLSTSDTKGRGMVQVPRLASWHKTSIYEGMTRRRMPGHGQYGTFRTISEANKTGWIHPGMQARHLAQKVEQHIERIAHATITAAMKGAFGG
jgi:hypothetical protein